MKTKEEEHTHVPEVVDAGDPSQDETLVEVTPENETTVTYETMVVRRDRKWAVSPKYDMAIRMYAASGLMIKDVAAHCKVSPIRLSTLINSPQGEYIINEVRSTQDRRYEALYAKVIDVLEAGLDHEQPQVALASAGLWLKHGKTQKVQVALSAEDVVQKILSGDYQEGDSA